MHRVELSMCAIILSIYFIIYELSEIYFFFLCTCWQLVITDVNVVENDERVRQAFDHITESFRAKDKRNVTESADAAPKQPVRFSLLTLFLN